MVFIRADTPEGQAIRRRCKQVAQEIANRIASQKQVSMEVHDVSPTYLSLTSVQLPASFQETIDDACALIFCGYFNSDTTDGRIVKIQKGREYVTELNIRAIANYGEGKEGVDSGFEKWGVWVEGEDLSHGFVHPSPTSAPEVFFTGYVVIPEGKSDIYKLNFFLLYS